MNNKKWYWALFVVTVLVVNVFAFPIALFSLFGTAEGTSIFSLDYLIAAGILFLANAVNIQLFLSLLRGDERLVRAGFLLVALEVLTLFYTLNVGSMHNIDLIILLVLGVLGVVLLGGEVTQRVKNNR